VPTGSVNGLLKVTRPESTDRWSRAAVDRLESTGQPGPGQL